MFILADFICENVKRPAARMYARPAVYLYAPDVGIPLVKLGVAIVAFRVTLMGALFPNC